MESPPVELLNNHLRVLIRELQSTHKKHHTKQIASEDHLNQINASEVNLREVNASDVNLREDNASEVNLNEANPSEVKLRKDIPLHWMSTHSCQTHLHLLGQSEHRQVHQWRSNHDTWGSKH